MNLRSFLKREFAILFFVNHIILNFLISVCVFFKGSLISGDMFNQTISGRLQSSSSHYSCNGAIVAYINGTNSNPGRYLYNEKYSAILFVSENPSSPNKWIR